MANDDDPKDRSDENFQLINPKDFESIQVIVKAKNNSTDFDIKSDKNPITLDEFTEDGLILQMPNNCCSAGHNLLLDISTVNAEKDLVFPATVKVLDVERLPDHRDRVTVKLVQYNEDVWKEFQEIYSKKQESILEFFHSVKGY